MTRNTNLTPTRAELLQVERRNRAISYMVNVGAYNRTKPHLKGSTLTFRYNMQTPKGIKTFERVVNVDTGMVRDKMIRNNSRTGIMLNMCTGTFMPY